MKQKSLGLALVVLLTSCASKNVKEAQTFKSPIDLAKIVMEPTDAPSDSVLPVRRNAAGDYYVLLNLNYAESNINVVEAIKNGNILAHRIVIKNSQGEEIGWDTINFQAYNVRKITTITTPSNVLLTRDGKKAVEESASAEKVKYVFEEQQYTDTDKIPQTIFLNSKYRPGSDSWVSIYAEIFYIQPVLGELCPVVGSGDTFDATCFNVQDRIFKTVREDNKVHIDKLRGELGQDPDTLTKLTIPKKETGTEGLATGSDHPDAEYQKILKTKEFYKATIEKEVSEINESGRRINPVKDKLYYQEWRLVSVPRYFQLVRGVTSEVTRPQRNIVAGETYRLQVRIIGAEAQNSILNAKIIQSGQNPYDAYTLKIPMPDRNAASRYGLRIGQSVTITITVTKVDERTKVIYSEPITP